MCKRLGNFGVPNFDAGLGGGGLVFGMFFGLHISGAYIRGSY